MSATRRDLARALKERGGGSIEVNDQWISLLLEIMADTICSQGRIELRGFGAFEARSIKPQTTVHPVSGETVHHSTSYTVDFKPSIALKEKLRQSQGTDHE